MRIEVFRGQNQPSFPDAVPTETSKLVAVDHLPNFNCNANSSSEHHNRGWTIEQSYINLCLLCYLGTEVDQ